MANFETHPNYNVEMERLETTTRAHADVLNVRYEQLLNTDAALHDTQETHAADTEKHLTAEEKTKIDGIAEGATKTLLANNLTTATAGYALDATQGKALADQLEQQTAVLTATLTAANWSEAAPYTQTVLMEGMTATDVPIIGVVLQGTAEERKAQQTAWNQVSEMETEDGSMTATCDKKKPEVDIIVRIKGR